MIKKTAVLAFALLITSFSSLAENSYCVSTDQGVFLVSESGTDFDLSSAWDDLYCIQENSRYVVGATHDNKTLYALCDASGRFITEPIYATLFAANNGIIFLVDNAYGYMDLNGTVQISADYTQLVPAGKNTFYALLTNPNDDQADQIYRVDKANRPTATGVWTTVPLTEAKDERMPFCDAHTALYGYLDLNGNIVIEAQYEYGGEFSNGLADAVSNGLHGLIDADGNWILSPEYNYIAQGNGFYAALKEHSECVVIGIEEKAELFRIEQADIEISAAGDYLIVTDSQSSDVYNSSGEKIYSCASDTSITEGVSGQLLLYEGDWGSETVHILESSGELQQKSYQHLVPLDENHYIFATMQTTIYTSDILETERYSVNYDSLREGLMDRTGKEILPAEYKEIRLVGEKRYLLIGENELEICDDEGTVLWQKIISSD